MGRAYLLRKCSPDAVQALQLRSLCGPHVGIDSINAGAVGLHVLGTVATTLHIHEQCEC